jgi:hypothetical protein
VTAAALAVVVVAVVSGLSISGASGIASPAPARSASSPVTAAVASLSAGGGPAAGRPAACTTGGAGTVSCSLGPAPSAGPSASGRVWTDLSTVLGADQPSPRWLGQMAYDPVDKYVVLFGGDNESVSGAYDDTWTYAGGVWTELNPAATPPGRYVGGMTWDAADGYILMFGGHDYPSGTTLNDTWTFIHGVWTELYPTVTPAARWRFVMSYDPADGYVLLFGGTDSTGATYYADTWEYLAGNWTDLTKKVTGAPAATYRAEMAYDPIGGYLVMFGGCTQVTCPDQSTYTYHNLTWKLLSPSTKPSARMYFGFTYDSVIGGIVLFGGATTSVETTTVQDTWAFSNGTWVQLTGLGTAPSDRGFVTMAFDGFDNYTLLFGGATSGTTTVPLGDTWILGPEVLARLNITPGAVDLGQQTVINATPLAAHGTVSFNYTGLPFGCNNTDVSVLNCTPLEAGPYVVTVHDNSTAGGESNASAGLTVGTDPAITSFTANRTTVTAGSSIQLTVAATGGSAPYHYGYSGLPPGCSTSNSPAPICSPSTGGSYTIQVTLQDAANFQVTSTVAITVNVKPAVSLVEADPGVVDVGQTTQISVTVSGGTAPLSYAYAGLPTGCTSANTADLSCTPAIAGAFEVAAVATDSDGWQSTLTGALAVNPDPSILAFAAAPVLLDLGTAVHFWLNATGGTGGLTYAYTGLPSGCDIGVASTGSCVPQSPGTYNLTGTVTDGLGFVVEQALTLTVNADPTVTAVDVAPSAIDVGQTAVIQVVFTGGTAPFTFAYEGLPIGCQGITTGSVNCTGRSPGTSTITVTLTDHLKESSTLGGTLYIYQRPTIGSFSASFQTFTVGTPTVLTVAASGGAGGNSFVYSGLPAGCASANSSTLTCTPTATGQFEVGVNVTDSLGVSATANLNLTVQGAASSSGGAGGLSTTLWVVIAIIVVVAIAAVALLMTRRRKTPPAAVAAPAEDAPWSEPEGPS